MRHSPDESCGLARVDCLKEPLVEILRATERPEEYVQAATCMRCEQFEKESKLSKTKTNKVAPSRRYISNHTLSCCSFWGILALDMKSNVFCEEAEGLGRRWNVWMHQAGCPKTSGNRPKAQQSWRAGKELPAAGVCVGTVGLDAPYQLGTVERNGHVWKRTTAKVIESKEIKGMKSMRMLSGEVNTVVNGKRRAGSLPKGWS